MPTFAPDLDAYFDRIGYTGERAPTLATLRDLHRLHPQCIPFENLSPLLGVHTPLDVASLQDKLVHGRRGGYCFEHNLLFRAVLEALGFEVSGLAARVRWQVPDHVVTPRTHMLLRVKLADEDWMADVGYGRITLTAPLRLRDGAVQSTPHEDFRLPEAPQGHVLQVRLATGWKTLYTFDLQPQAQVDYELTHWYLGHHPGSPFVTGLMAARAQPDGRHALLNARYTRHHADGTSEARRLGCVGEMRQVLEGAFGIRLPEDSRLEEKLAGLVATASD